MIKSPLLIIGCPRSGTTLLYHILSEAPELWSIGFESKAIIEQYHHPSVKDWESGALDAEDITYQSRVYISNAFEKQSVPGTFWKRFNHFRRMVSANRFYRAIKKQGKTEGTSGAIISAFPQQGMKALQIMVMLRNKLIHHHQIEAIHLLEKTPENCLRLPFLLDLFPDAHVLYLIRDGRSNIHSLMEGWRHPHLFPGYRVPAKITIPGDTRGRWAFTLIPGWQELTSSFLEEVCAWQWIRCNEAVLMHREKMKSLVPYLTVRYEDMLTKPQQIFKQIADFAGIDYDKSFTTLSGGLPHINVISDPDPEKWRKKNSEAIQRIIPIIRPMMDHLGYEVNT